ncbi:hypothetical protein AB6A40_000630 [Gnathostoma spinigerum]|uniref:GDT1 family protein n=1 Tax=Gnathostoma spinigerum TaxID=75299 RepID=A0ABD6E4I8_9BILA
MKSVNWLYSLFVLPNFCICIHGFLIPEKDGSQSVHHNSVRTPPILAVQHTLASVTSAAGQPLFVVTKATPKNITSNDVTFYHAVLASFSVIIVSELGDKTWFIAAIMAMRHSRLTIFFGAMSALALMTALSAGLGWVTQVIPRSITYYISTVLFALFGLKMLYEGYHMSPSEGKEEYEEAHAEVQKKSLLRESERVSDMEIGKAGQQTNSACAVLSFVSTLFLEAFTMTFLAEWGDRSQLTTIILAARENVYGVVLGGIGGHALCTGIAVVGGKLVATQISVRTVTLIGGVVFIVFALSAFFIKP